MTLSKYSFHFVDLERPGEENLPVNIFLMVSGLSPRGESLPPSKLKPSPVPSFFNITVTGGPRGTSTNFKSGKINQEIRVNQISPTLEGEQ